MKAPKERCTSLCNLLYQRKTLFVADVYIKQTTGRSGRPNFMIHRRYLRYSFPSGLVVRISRSHRDGRGSIPRLGTHLLHRLVGLVVRRPPRERKIPGSNPACAGIFSGSSHTSDLKIGIPVATLPGAWRYKVSAGIGRPGVSIL